MRRAPPLVAVLLLSACSAPAPMPDAEPGAELAPARCSGDEAGLVSGLVQDLGHNPQPIVGEEVWEWQCGDTPGITRQGGAFAMGLVRRDDPVVEVAADGYIPVIVGSPGTESEHGLEIPNYLRVDEEQFRLEDFGEQYDETRGAVLVHLYSFGSVQASQWTAEAVVDIDLPYDSVWALDETDEHVPSNVVPADSTSSEIWFSNVEPGMVTIELQLMPFAQCTGPTVLPVRADTYTHANYVCDRRQ